MLPWTFHPGRWLQVDLTSSHWCPVLAGSRLCNPGLDMVISLTLQAAWGAWPPLVRTPLLPSSKARDLT